MMRVILAAALVAGGLSAVLAQDVIGERRDLMKRSGAQARIGTQMMRGEEPFDLAKAQNVFKTYIAKAERLPALFPENSKTGGETIAGPAIWEKPDEWKAAIAKFEKDSRAGLAATKDLESLKEQLPIVHRNCVSCHETFRLSRK